MNADKLYLDPAHDTDVAWARRKEATLAALKMFRMTLDAVRRHSEWVESRHGISAVELWALWELAQSPGLRSVDLAKALAMPRASTDTLLAGLIRRGLAKQSPSNGADGPALFSPTFDGQRIADSSPQYGQGVLKAAMGSLPDASLAKLVQAMGEPAAATAVPGRARRPATHGRIAAAGRSGNCIVAWRSIAHPILLETTMDTQIDLFLSSLHTFWGEIALFLPKLLAALVLLLVGLILARLLRAGVKRGLEVLGFGRMAEKSGLEALIKQAGVDLSLAGIIAGTVYWLALLVVAVSAANSLGLDSVAGLANKVILYLPKVVVAILVLVFGTLFARGVNRLVFAWLDGSRFPGALGVSTGVEYAVQIFALFLALEQLEIGTTLLTVTFAIVFGGLVFALALAFGLGGRDWASERIREWSHKG